MEREQYEKLREFAEEPENMPTTSCEDSLKPITDLAMIEREFEKSRIEIAEIYALCQTKGFTTAAKFANSLDNNLGNDAKRRVDKINKKLINLGRHIAIHKANKVTSHLRQELEFALNVPGSAKPSCEEKSHMLEEFEKASLDMVCDLKKTLERLKVVAAGDNCDEFESYLEVVSDKFQHIIRHFQHNNPEYHI
ncbi:unnamed protein product [Caenorhabditis bovis]|uniref:Uncharacterized protein n=1 Tax=Caenorhabditis bovis TaxID=2654633 RepID=A0A8S1EZ85_9PELO|nr:unnamed protein product [Caenorhabditis bovis]